VRVFAVADPGRLGLYQRGPRGDLDRVFDRADLEPDVDAPQILRGELNVLGDELFESGNLDPKDVPPSRSWPSV
jgi:hypothetical protein